MVSIDMDATGKKIKSQMSYADLLAKHVTAACNLATPNAVWRWQKNMSFNQNTKEEWQYNGCHSLTIT